MAIGSDFNRYSFRLNLDNQATKWLKLSTSLNFYQTKEKLASTSEDVIGECDQPCAEYPGEEPGRVPGAALLPTNTAPMRNLHL